MKTSCNFRGSVVSALSLGPWHRDWLHDVGILEATDVPVFRMSRSFEPTVFHHQKKTILSNENKTWLFRVGDDGKGKRDYNKPLGFFCRGSIDKFWLFLLTWLTGEPSQHWIVKNFGPFTSTHLLVSVTSILSCILFICDVFFWFRDLKGKLGPGKWGPGWNYPRDGTITYPIPEFGSWGSSLSTCCQEKGNIFHLSVGG